MLGNAILSLATENSNWFCSSYIYEFHFQCMNKVLDTLNKRFKAINFLAIKMILVKSLSLLFNYTHSLILSIKTK